MSGVGPPGPGPAGRLRGSLRLLKVRLMPWVLFAATVAGAGWFYGRMVTRPTTVGFAEAVVRDLGPESDRRIVSVVVAPGDRVREGDPLAVFDAADLDAELSIAQAERDALEAELAAAARGERRDVASDQRTLQRDLARDTVARTEAMGEARVAEAARRALQRRLSDLRPLVEAGLATRQEVARTEVELARARREAEAARARAEALDATLAATEARLHGVAEDGDPRGIAVVLEPLVRRRATVERRIAAVQAARDRRVLRAPAAGTVERVHRQAGEVAGPRAPVLRLTEAPTGRVTVCLSDRDARRAQVGDRAVVVPRANRRADKQALEAVVVGVHPTVGELPARCWRTPRIPEQGRLVAATLVDDARRRELVAGESFHVRLVPSQGSPEVAVGAEPSGLRERGMVAGAGRAAASGEDTAAPPAAGLPSPAVPMALPEALAARTVFEPSGVVWDASRSRLVVASDDTGRKRGGAEWHVPWLFEVQTDGRVADAPLPVSGVEELNDVEALAPAPGGGLWLLSSQSVSKKGKRPASRTRFARLEPEGRGYALARERSLIDALAEAPTALRRRLGVSSPESLRRLNLEGLCSDGQGGLIVGVKAPVTSDGRALLWRLPDPDAFLAGRSLADAGLTLHATAYLPVLADGAERPGGVAECLPTPDGRLLVAVTASRTATDPRPSRQDGALYVLDVTRTEGEASDATRVHVFAGRTPEGLAAVPGIAGGAGGVWVAFDAGRAAASFVEVPWPSR